MCWFCLACFFFFPLSKGSWQNCKLFQFPFPSFWVKKMEPPVEEVAGSWWREEISSFPLKPMNACLLGSNDAGTVKSWALLKSISTLMTDFQESKQQFLSYSLTLYLLTLPNMKNSLSCLLSQCQVFTIEQGQPQFVYVAVMCAFCCCLGFFLGGGGGRRASGCFAIGMTVFTQFVWHTNPLVQVRWIINQLVCQNSLQNLRPERI